MQVVLTLRTLWGGRVDVANGGSKGGKVKTTDSAVDVGGSAIAGYEIFRDPPSLQGPFPPHRQLELRFSPEWESMLGQTRLLELWV